MSRFYGFPVFDLTPGVKIALEAAVPGLRAEDFLDAHGGRLDPDGLRAAVLAATGDEAAAEAAWTQRAADVLRAD